MIVFTVIGMATVVLIGCGVVAAITVLVTLLCSDTAEITFENGGHKTVYRRGRWPWQWHRVDEK